MRFEIEKLKSRSAPIARLELADFCQLSNEEIIELMEYGVVRPLVSTSRREAFSWEMAIQLKLANQIRLDYDLDLFTVVIFMDYQNKINHLDEKIQSLELQLQKFHI